jgi:hypothetical protein
MRSYLSYWLLLSVCGIMSCQTRTAWQPGDPSKFSIKIEALNKVNAPALQSFVWARYHDSTDGHDYWLLFGGRTNPAGNSADAASVGGLHQAVNYDSTRSDTGNHSTNNDYAYHSFPIESFNQKIYVYDVDSDNLSAINVGAFLQPVSSHIPAFPFISVNALARQYDSTLYVAGGYGPRTMNPPSPGGTITYYTNNGLTQLNVPSVIRCIRNPLQCRPLDNFPVRYDTNSLITSTGGELYKLNDTFYIAGGQHYKETDSILSHDSDVVVYDQKLIYLTSVIPFTIQNGQQFYSLNINVDTAGIITDVPLDSLNTNYADTTSKFRRRDVVVAPTFINDTFTNGFVFHGGVFRPSAVADSPGVGPFRAWDDALFIHPSLSPKYSFSTNSSVYQSYNVYSCPNFVGYDGATQNVHTFLMGGIGDGQANYWVSGFTHSVTQTIQPLGNPRGITAIPDTTGFLIGGSPKFYGAEAAFIYKTDKRLVFMQSNPDILDLNATLTAAGDSIVVGYIYGGIEADVPNPGGYKGGMTRATNKIFKVTLYRKE